MLLVDAEPALSNYVVGLQAYGLGQSHVWTLWFLPSRYAVGV